MRRQGLVSKERYLRRDTAHAMRPASRFRTIPMTHDTFWYVLICFGTVKTRQRWRVLTCVDTSQRASAPLGLESTVSERPVFGALGEGPGGRAPQYGNRNGVLLM